MWIPGLSGFRVMAMAEAESGRLTIRIERRGVRRYTCMGVVAAAPAGYARAGNGQG